MIPTQSWEPVRASPQGMPRPIIGRAEKRRTPVGGAPMRRTPARWPSSTWPVGPIGFIPCRWTTVRWAANTRLVRSIGFVPSRRTPIAWHSATGAIGPVWLVPCWRAAISRTICIRSVWPIGSDSWPWPRNRTAGSQTGARSRDWPIDAGPWPRGWKGARAANRRPCLWTWAAHCRLLRGATKAAALRFCAIRFKRKRQHGLR